MVDNGGLAPPASSGCTLAWVSGRRAISARRSGRLTSRRAGRTCSTPTRSLRLALLFAVTPTTTTQAAIPSQTLDRSASRGRPLSQDRTLTNAGIHSEISYVRGINNVKAGVPYEQTILTENDQIGIVDPTLNAPCLAANTNPVTDGFYPFAPYRDSPIQASATAGLQPNVAANPNAPGNPANRFLSTALYPLFNPTLLPYDLTRGGSLFRPLRHFLCIRMSRNWRCTSRTPSTGKIGRSTWASAANLYNGLVHREPSGASAWCRLQHQVQ